MSLMPPPAETLARVQPGTRLGVGPAGVILHVLTGAVTRCGARTSAAWTDYGLRTEGGIPCRRLCRRCLAGLPASVRKALVPTVGELRRVHELEAREAAAHLVARLAELRTEALVDGSAYERTVLVHAAPAGPLAVPRGAKPPTRAERDRHVSGAVATARDLTLLDLLNHLDPSRPTAPGWRVWFVNPPELGTPVTTGGEYDARLWMGRKR